MPEKIDMSMLAEKTPKMPTSKHYFHIKGIDAEAMLHELAEKTFLTDWCYPNPILPNGKELCDLLVVFDNIAIIWQLKDTKLQKDGFFKESDMKKNLSQLSGARRQLFELQTPIQLKNPRRGIETFDSAVIEEIYLISAFFGEPPEAFGFGKEIKGKLVHVFTRRFTEIVLNELDTISDFCGYLRATEDLSAENIRVSIMGGEEELLAYYLKNNRSFEKLKNYTHIMLEADIWDDLQKHPQYVAKRKADRVSYGWDEIIDRAHTGKNPEYERIARELARPSRVERRILSKSFFEAHIISHRSNLDFRRFFLADEVVYCFLFQDDPEPRNNRKSHLKAMCHVTRSKYRNKKIIGIATGKKIRRTCTYDLGFVQIQDWTPEDENLLKEIKKHTNILENPKETIVHEDEYPNPDS